MSAKQRAILVGAVVTGILSTSYLTFINVLCCLGVIVGGIVTAQQFASRSTGATQTGDAALLGAGAGALGSVLASAFDWMLKPIGLDMQSITKGFMESYQQTLQESGQQVPPALEQAMQQGGDPGVAMMAINLAFGIVLYGIFGAIGGAIGASIFGKDGGAGSQSPEEMTPEQ